MIQDRLKKNRPADLSTGRFFVLTEPLIVIAGLTRNPLNGKVSFWLGRWRMLLRHDGKSFRFVLPSLVPIILLLGIR